MKKQTNKLLNTIDNLYDTAYSVLESYDHDQQALFVARTERNIYKTAFEQIKSFVGSIKISNERELQNFDYVTGLLKAYHDIYKEIRTIEEINGLIQVKNKKEGI